ncbi:type 2 periplasmic-binding domain-containing protein [Rubrivivax gelatinosus]|uniref:Phosphate ABC transporter substrate-binding protein n=1 Tax=Rubrivivax gelatinosus (strain NBRC 100245 / IL144) TaxID=983917 RepID=I0HVN9_RUBGI|nr:hypothetical protein [Rubrivivax gelatinosus]MBG6079007.1 ABC-type phosphate transport system substrate-binding protein [Rubrivivax gelatinosus]BAL97076.1 hypothetical protein RGE_37370 [Rubrivivax gelatinosus IL144]
MKNRHLPLVAGLLFAAFAARAELVVIANPAVGPLSKEQVADLFLGKSSAHNPVDLPDASPQYAEFYKKATGRDVAQVKSTWSRIVFSGKGQAPRQLPDSVAVRKAVAADPKGVGYVEKSAVDGSVKAVLTLD